MLYNHGKPVSYYVAKAGLELVTIVLPQSPKYWDCRIVQPSWQLSQLQGNIDLSYGKDQIIMLLWKTLFQTPELPCNESCSENITGPQYFPITTLLATESISMTYMAMTFCNAFVFFSQFSHNMLGLCLQT